MLADPFHEDLGPGPLPDVRVVRLQLLEESKIAAKYDLVDPCRGGAFPDGRVLEAGAVELGVGVDQRRDLRAPELRIDAELVIFSRPSSGHRWSPPQADML